jgi:transposase
LRQPVEIGDWTRFSGSSIGAYVGLVRGEYSSGASRVQGSITKAGNAHVRRDIALRRTELRRVRG